VEAAALTTAHPPVAGHGDRQLVSLVRAGDDRAFEELYARYRRRIAAYVYGMVSDHGRAEDIAQDVFVSALRRMRETERPIAFRPWIYEIAKNACIDAYRRRSRAEEVALTGDDGQGGGDRLYRARRRLARKYEELTSGARAVPGGRLARGLSSGALDR